MNDKMSQAISLAKILIGNHPTVTDAQINKAIDDLSNIPGYTDINKAELHSELLSLYSVKIDAIQILDKRESRAPWLKAFKAEDKSQWLFWKRYKEYLKTQKNFAPKAISHIDDLTDRILDRLYDPTRTGISINKKGLVVGQVQSGKTANYTGLICKAADAGFNMIIVLAGIHNNLRSQTQTRLDEGFLGFDTQYERAYSINNTTKMGVGLIAGYENAIANSYTTSLEKGDFTSRAANTAGFNFANPQPILLVIKKNVSVLKRLHTWLATQASEGKISVKSLLMIDDEADHASINTNKKETDPTKINGWMRKILLMFNRSAYVGYTATPFANIFIPHENEEDLFPKDFIINLPAPSNYIGPEKVFGTSVLPSDNDDQLPIVNVIDDYFSFVPTKHNNNTPLPMLSNMPDSLKTAIKCFIMTCAVRMLRGQGNKHNSMLVHVTRYQMWQNHIKDLVEQQFNYYKAELEANDTAILSEFRKIYEEDTETYKSYKTVSSTIKNSTLSDLDSKVAVHEWEDIKPYLRKAVQKIEVKSINGSSGDALTYYEHEKDGISVIAIGGDKLSRGLTLEGLSVSYFLRASKMYDTLMQMGRWFGYRPGYIDLCRLFTSSELNEWFTHITMASEELRAEFNYLAESGGTPDNYALKVRNHPGNLQITSVAKMRYTKHVQVSWATRLVETYHLPMSPVIKDANLASTKEFISNLGKFERKESGYLWRNIPAADVCDYLMKFTVATSLKKVDLSYICRYIQMLNECGELTNWSVALMSRKSTLHNSSHQFRDDIEVNNFWRTKSDNTDETSYCIRKNHIVGGREDELIDLNNSVLDKALATTKVIKPDWKETYPAPEVVRDKFRPMDNPLLIIYPLNPKAANEYLYSDNDNPFVGLVMSFPNTNQANIGVSYVANQVADFADNDNDFEQNNDNVYGES